MPGTTYGGDVAILAPRGRDAKVAQELLDQTGIASLIVADLAELQNLIEEHIGAVLIAEEAVGEEISGIRAALAAQPAWSDIPFIVLTSGRAPKRTPAEEERIDALGNVVLLPRPLHRDDIVRAVRSALKARQRQFEARARMEELRDSQIKLRKSERKFHAIANSIDQMIWSTRPDGYHDYFNDRWYEYTGVSPGSTDGERWVGRFHPDDQQRAWERWRHSLDSGKPYEIEYRLRDRSGEYRWVLGKAQAVRDEDGQIARWYGSCTEIDDQVRVREALAASQDRLEGAVAERTQELSDLYRKTPVALLSTDGEGRIVTVSERWLSFMGYDRAEEVLGKQVTEFMAPECLTDHEGAYSERMAEANVVYDLPYTTIKRSGERAEVLVSARSTHNAAGEVDRVMASVVDVTQRKAAETARDKAEHALRQSQKLETIGQLTGGVAHDFNNLLMAVRSSLELLRKRLPEGDKRAHSYLANALAGTERGATLTQRMLAFARKQELDPQPVDVAALLPGMRDLLERSLGPEMDIALDLGKDIPPALVDANQLEMAVLNLAVNARDAMEGSGRLAIRLDCVHAGPGSPQLEPGEYVRIRVEDTGAGMDAETLARAMEPFFTTKGVGSGTGLGLSMVHGLTSQLGGSFQLQSRPGEGTTAAMYLPVASDGPAGPAIVSAPAEQPGDAFKPLKILAVDDDALVLFGTVALLEDLGHEVQEAGSGAQALDMLSKRDDVDLVITDQAMPNMTGVALAREIHRDRPDLPVVLASGYAEMPEGAKQDIVARLEKPFSHDDLDGVIRTIFAG
ncbi:hybrid sensor histidine kinase/response regulator [Erythrobacter sp. QSSC1-22B]|uniref:hybrid sensor histidine kinase/response regulator n=1 Tax=Erythrobacter sp. QSSC1-22B TaxID=1860125 RepID=UPI0008048D02|nr:hybrid sensor histidine kinase/response regulator [Erythrobacter sp. QSSC1-22B]OBX20815.1 hybrid sensor histidine kinase/response regulator [Erythrobacter sp. QSSC1-22B]